MRAIMAIGAAMFGVTPTLAATSRGLTVTLRAYPLDGQSLDFTTLETAREILAERIAAMNIQFARVTVVGSDQIRIDVSAIDPDGATLPSLIRRNFVEIVDPEGAYLADGTKVSTSVGGAPWSPPTDMTATASPVTGPVYHTIVSSTDIADAFSTENQLGQVVVGFQLTDAAATRFYKFTSNNLGEPLSIVIDNVVVSTATIYAAISDQGIIEGLPVYEVAPLVASLKSRPLPVHLEIVQSSTR